MSVDKRQVATDALETLGTILKGGEGRDAIHLAVEPAVAAHPLEPGEHVGFLPDGTVSLCEKPVGIVDPFLKVRVETGQRFWLVVYPRQITSLRHVWTHPAFPPADPVPARIETPRAESPEVTAAREAITSIAYLRGVDPDELIERARYFLRDGTYWSEGGRFEGEYLPDEFWGHYEIVTGTTVPEEQRESFFSCSC